MKTSFEKITGFFKSKYHALSYWLAREDGIVAWAYYHIWHRGLSGVGKYYVFFTVAIVVYLLWAGGYKIFFSSIEFVDALFKRKTDGSLPALDSEDYEDYRNLMLGLAGLAALPFFLIRMWVEERKTKTAEQGHMTDRINKAVEALGAEKTSKKIDEETREVREFTEPNLEVRIGAILALERISQDSQRDHWPVMEILTAYLKNNTSLEKNPLPENLGDFPEKQNYQDEDERKAIAKYKTAINQYLDKTPKPRSDIQLIMTVLGRRSWGARVISYYKKQKLDLRSLNLCKIDLAEANLQFANFSATYLIGAKLDGANLQSTDLELANLQNADLNFANLQRVSLRDANLWNVCLFKANLQRASLRGANLWNVGLFEANLQNADLNFAKLQRAQLELTNLQNANLSYVKLQNAKLDGANLQRASLRSANLKNADLIEANLQNAQLDGANLKSAELDEANLQNADLSWLNLEDFNEESLKQLQEELNYTFGNEDTRLTNKFVRPKHWALSFEEQTKIINAGLD